MNKTIYEYQLSNINNYKSIEPSREKIALAVEKKVGLVVDLVLINKVGFIL